MKKIGLIFGMMFMISGFIYAQSNNDYKSRNHKLNKGSLTSGEAVENQIVANRKNADSDVYDYKNRNTKFHKNTHGNALIIEKEKIVNDYKALNYKFSKGQNTKFINRVSQDDMLTER